MFYSCARKLVQTPQCCSHDCRGDKSSTCSTTRLPDCTLDRRDDISEQVEINFAAAEDVTDGRVERYHQLWADRSQMSRSVQIFGGNDQLGESFCSSQTHSTFTCQHRLLRIRQAEAEFIKLIVDHPYQTQVLRHKRQPYMYSQILLAFCVQLPI